MGARQPGGAAAPGCSKVVDKGIELGIEQFAARDDDQVGAGHTGQWLVQPENLSNQSFSAVSANGVAQFP